MPTTKLSIKAHAECVQMSVLDVVSSTVRLQSADASWRATVPLRNFPWLIPGDTLVVHLGITKVALEELPDEESKLIMPGRAN